VDYVFKNIDFVATRDIIIY